MGNNGNRATHYLQHVRPDVIEIPLRITGAGAAPPVDKDAAHFGTEIASIARTSAGLYVITLNRKYAGAIESLDVGTIYGATRTADLEATVTAIDLTVPNFTLNTFLSGPRQIAAWSGATAVAANTTGALPKAGSIVAVDITAGGVTGAGNLRSTAPATTRDIQVVYDAAGIPTLNTLAGDAVTAVKYVQIQTADVPTDMSANDNMTITINVRARTRN